MRTLKMEWTALSKQQFDELRQRAVDTGHAAEFARAHNEIVAILRDLDRALEKGDPLYHTKQPGGVICHLLHDFISVTYAVFEQEPAGWVIRYVSVPFTWPT